jgi:hypothetical protein
MTKKPKRRGKPTKLARRVTPITRTLRPEALNQIARSIKGKQPSVFGLMSVLTEAGIDKICEDLERSKRAGEKVWTVADHRRLREEVYGSHEPGLEEGEKDTTK